MRILIAVHNLIVKKSHLMPWRTVCEVTHSMQANGHDAFLISLGEENTEIHGHLIPPETREICKSTNTFSAELKKELERVKPEIIFWPITWRDSLKKIKAITEYNIPVVFWFPGGIYTFSACTLALKSIGLKNSLPYLIETLSNKKKQINNFKKLGVQAILTMTQTTADCAISAGWPKEKTFTIPPGKEHKLSQKSQKSHNLPDDFKNWLGEKQFYLFMGPPSGIRGIFSLLKAFEMAASQDSDIRLVCLFRSDGTLDSKKVKTIIAGSKHRNKIYSAWQSMTPEDLNSFIAACHAVTMPFVLVPSEIPLAIIEAMAWGKPVITTSPGGTGDFVKQFGLSPKVGDCNKLADAMITLHQDIKLYKEKCQKTTATYSTHPNWCSVARQWAAVANLILKTNTRSLGQ